MKKVLLFGVFDGVHDGHRDLFRQAREFGDYLMVAVAPDNIVQQLKHSLPRAPLGERVAQVAREPDVDEAFGGDELLGSYHVIRSHVPDTVALGYDQQALYDDLTARKDEFDFDFEVVMLQPHRPEELHNSLLDGR